jgi:hypothetical protein
MILDVQFVENEKKFDISFGNYQTVTEFVGGSPYDGEYEITPKVDGQTMATKNKVMLNDVTILAIPYYVTGNTTGGDTVYIAKEV